MWMIQFDDATLQAFAFQCLLVALGGAVGVMLAGAYHANSYANRLKRQLAAQKLELEAEAAENLWHLRTQWNDARQNEKDIAVIYEGKFEKAKAEQERLKKLMNMLFIGLLIVVGIVVFIMYAWQYDVKLFRTAYIDCKDNRVCLNIPM